MDLIKDYVARCDTPSAHRLLELGKVFRVGPQTFSQPRAKAHECFRNAMVVAASPEGAGWNYCEGLAVYSGALVHHAWLADEDDVVRDDTFQPAAAEPFYFGLKIPADQVRVAADRPMPNILLLTTAPITDEVLRAADRYAAEGRFAMAEWMRLASLAFLAREINVRLNGCDRRHVLAEVLRLLGDHKAAAITEVSPS